METKIKWNEGEGYITATYEGSGSGSASISSDVNEGIDREQSIKVETTHGNMPKSESVSIKQLGMREVFFASDGDFILADGGTFNVLKYMSYNSKYKGAEVEERLDSVGNSVSLKFTDVSALSWVSDSTYTDYPYRCDLTCTGVTANDYADVAFSVEQVESGDYAPVCETNTDIVSIWSAVNTSITIPTIIIVR